LHRFFEDPDCGALIWDKDWVKKLLIDIPKQLNWNAMRVCVGIVPDFWYDLADEYGMMFQNEWMYWQNHGWNEQIRKEYTDWIWNDGTHPSIVIWDAINENWDGFIGNSLIPELKKLDQTRIWDAGYMTDEHMITDEMDEPHPYTGYLPWISKAEFEESPYTLGNLDITDEQMLNSKAAQLVNEYGWVWLWRNGQPAKLTLDFYNYYLGENSSPEQNREFQAYWLQLETEWLRSEKSTAGVLAFCYLTNNYGYTGDWFIGNIKDLKPGITLEWFKHCFAPAAVFINLPDGRYNKHVKPLKPGSELNFFLYGVNDYTNETSGKIYVRLLDEKGNMVNEKEIKVTIAKGRTDFPISILLPDKSGGFLLLALFYKDDSASDPVISRRYIKIGENAAYNFYEYSSENRKD
ncbi:MAG TPA: glycoside hydrolase family 2 TIM barrel-domain containing protein, partial [Ignavibacteriaceae bacterium]|nr:glycoside hydrolase family 2 TIM barrel-domain containing protein [Ignavibacteriaceae bacterium]